MQTKRTFNPRGANGYEHDHMAYSGSGKRHLHDIVIMALTPWRKGGASPTGFEGIVRARKSDGFEACEVRELALAILVFVVVRRTGVPSPGTSKVGRFCTPVDCVTGGSAISSAIVTNAVAWQRKAVVGGFRGQ